MSETVKPQVGDRVRVTIESVVREVDEEGFVLAGRYFVHGGSESRTIEILEPRSFRPGTVWEGAGERLFRTTAGGWLWGSGTRASVDDDEVRQWIAEGDGEIVYEPPA